MQIGLRFSHGGLGIKSTEAHAPAAFVGRTITVLEQVLTALRPHHRQRLLADGTLLSTQPLRDVQAALQQLLGSGIPRDRLAQILSPCWLQWAEQDGDPLLAHIVKNAEAAEPEFSQGLQAKLALLTDEQQCRRIDALIGSKPLVQRHADNARRRSQCAKGAMAWAGVVVSRDPRLDMPAPAHRETVRRALGIERDFPNGKCATCNRPMSSVHARRCGGTRTRRHDALNKAFADAAKREAKVPLMHTESNCCFNDGYRQDFRMDLVIEGGQMIMPGASLADAHKGAAIDFAIIDPTTPNAVVQAAAQEASAAEAVALVKRTHYSTPLSETRYTFFALVFEIFGAVSSDTHKLIGALAARQAAASNGMYALSHCVNDWRQRLSVRMQNEVSQGMMFEWLRMKPFEHQPPPDKWAFARRKLLLAQAPVPAGD